MNSPPLDLNPILSHHLPSLHASEATWCIYRPQQHLRGCHLSTQDGVARTCPPQNTCRVRFRSAPLCDFSARSAALCFAENHLQVLVRRRPPPSPSRSLCRLSSLPPTQRHISPAHLLFLSPHVSPRPFVPYGAHPGQDRFCILRGRSRRLGAAPPLEHCGRHVRLCAV